MYNKNITKGIFYELSYFNPLNRLISYLSREYFFHCWQTLALL